MSSNQFDFLPVETIQRIVSLGFCSDALTLRHVSRKLNSICSNPVIFIWIIYHSNGITLEDHAAALAQWPLLQELRSQKNWQVCARYALADMYLNRFTSNTAKDFAWTSMLYDGCWKWLPELIATGHKTAVRDGVTIMRTYQLRVPMAQIERQVSLPQTGDREYYIEIAIRFIFIIVCDSFRDAVSPRRGTLMADEQVRLRQTLLAFHFEDSARWLIEEFLPMINRPLDIDYSLLHAYSSLEQTNMMTTWLAKADQDLHWSRCMVLCMVISTLLYECTMRSDSNSSGLPSSGMTFDAYLGLPPAPIDIPLNDLYQTDTPFNDRTTTVPNGFATRHLPKTAAAAFLEDAEWAGYCFSDEIDGKECLAVHNLRLKVTSDCADHITLEGSCERMTNGCMNLTGTLFKQTGWAQLDAGIESANGLYTAVPLSVMLTPFGMIGSWKLHSAATIFSSAGWIWLWKKSWQSVRVEPIWERPANTALAPS